MEKITNEIIQKILDFTYKPELSEETYIGLDILNLCKGNIQYCLVLMDRLDWQAPETLIQEDIIYDEILLIENQYVMTNGNSN